MNTSTVTTPSARRTTRESARRVGADHVPAVLVVDAIAAAEHTCAGCWRTIRVGAPMVESHRVGDLEGMHVVRYCTRVCRGKNTQ